MSVENRSPDKGHGIGHASAQAPPSGVKGWLLFLCIWLVILGPIWGILMVIGDWMAFSPYFEDVPNLNIAVGFDMALIGCLTLFGIYAAYTLWSCTPNAIFITKIFLIIRALFFVIGPFLFVAIAKLPSTDDFLAQQMTNGIGGLIASTAWYLYLKLSERVANTYGTDDPLA